jgi:hypothetical protein
MSARENGTAVRLHHEGIRVGEIVAYRAWRVIAPRWWRAGDDRLHSVLFAASLAISILGARADSCPEVFGIIRSPRLPPPPRSEAASKQNGDVKLTSCWRMVRKQASDSPDIFAELVQKLCIPIIEANNLCKLRAIAPFVLHDFAPDFDFPE